MALGKIGLKFLGRVFSRSAKAAPKIESVITKGSGTKILGPNALERTFVRDGKTLTARLEYVTENGKQVSKMQITGENFSTINRTKTIERGKSDVFGGEKITIDKRTTKYFVNGETTKMTKEYNKLGELEHKEYSITHESGSGLNDWSKSAVQDRVYENYPLTSSTGNMLVNPNYNRYFQHSLTDRFGTRTNYNQFAQEGTNYENIIKAQEAAAKEAAAKAAAEKAAAEAAAKAAAEAEAAKLPRINLGRVGIDVKDLKIAETTLADGSLQRIYRMPGSDKIVLKTVEKGILRQEWLYDTKFGDMVYLKQVGKEKPYILAKRGNAIQLSGNRDLGYTMYGKPATEPLDGLYYYDGTHSAIYAPRQFNINGQVGQVKANYKIHPSYKNGTPEEKAYLDRVFANYKPDSYGIKNYSQQMQEIPKAKSGLVVENTMENGTLVVSDLYQPNVGRKPAFPEVFEEAKSKFQPELEHITKPFEA